MQRQLLCKKVMLNVVSLLIPTAVVRLRLVSEIFEALLESQWMQIWNDDDHLLTSGFPHVLQIGLTLEVVVSSFWIYYLMAILSESNPVLCLAAHCFLLPLFLKERHSLPGCEFLVHQLPKGNWRLWKKENYDKLSWNFALTSWKKYGNFVVFCWPPGVGTLLL